MAKITVTYGAECLEHIDDINPAEVLDAGDEALEKLARQLGHRLEIDRVARDGRGPHFEVESKSFDAYNVEKRLADRFEREWQWATDRAIENA